MDVNKEADTKQETRMEEKGEELYSWRQEMRQEMEQILAEKEEFQKGHSIKQPVDLLLEKFNQGRIDWEVHDGSRAFHSKWEIPKLNPQKQDVYTWAERVRDKAYNLQASARELAGKLTEYFLDDDRHRPWFKSRCPRKHWGDPDFILEQTIIEFRREDMVALQDRNKALLHRAQQGGREPFMDFANRVRELCDTLEIRDEKVIAEYIRLGTLPEIRRSISKKGITNLEDTLREGKRKQESIDWKGGEPVDDLVMLVKENEKIHNEELRQVVQLMKEQEEQRKQEIEELRQIINELNRKVTTPSLTTLDRGYRNSQRKLMCTVL